ncbi:MAG: lysophospholipase [Bacteroidales bacterium]
MDLNIRLSDGLLLRGYKWSPSGEARASVIMVHGLGEHIMRYSDWATKFTSAGIIFQGVDLPGHGKSDGKRGHIKNYAQIDEMLDILVEESTKSYPERPVFIYGHSMGGGIVLSYLIKRNPHIKGAIVTSPWIRLAFPPSGVKVTLARIMKSILPSLTQHTGLVTEHLSHKQDEVDKYEKDPLVHGRISVSLFFSAVSSGEYILKNAEIINVPVLLLHGAEDKITSPVASMEIASRSNRVTFRLWEGGYHELHNEPFRDEVFSVIINWIKSNME